MSCDGYITYEEAKAHLGFGFATNKIPAWAIKKVGRRNWFLEWVIIDWRKSIEIEMLKDWFIAYSTEQPTPFEICAMNEECKFSNALSKLPERDRMVLCARMGISQSQKTLAECSRMFGRTRERIRQIEQNACEKLKTYMEAE